MKENKILQQKRQERIKKRLLIFLKEKFYIKNVFKKRNFVAKTTGANKKR